MKLSRIERLMLSNQYRILEALYPDERDSFANSREAIESGFEIEYDWHTEYIHRDVVTVDECREVIEILDMFTALGRAFNDLGDKSGIEESKIRFVGFDGNNETKQLAYAEYLQKNGKFSDLTGLDGLNSHMPLLPNYRRMVVEWLRSASRYSLTKEDIIRIGEARSLSRYVEQREPSIDEELDELRDNIYSARKSDRTERNTPS